MEKSVKAIIETLDPQGVGVGIAVDEKGSSFKVKVPCTLPGDEVLCSLTKKKRGNFTGSLLQVIKGAEERQEPLCTHFGTCGGCLWQHISQEKQLEIKQGWIQSLFASFIAQGAQLKTIIPCDRSYYYRNKMEYSFSQDKYGQRYLGLFMRGMRSKVFNLEECHLGPEWFVKALKCTKKWWESTSLNAYHHFKDSGSLRTLTVREGSNTQQRMVILTVSGNPDYALSKEQIASFKQMLLLELGQPLSIFIRIQQLLKGEPTRFFEMGIEGQEDLVETLHLQGLEQEEMSFHISPMAFFQPNTQQAAKIYQQALALAEIKKDQIVFDLYCGTGTIALLAARYASQVTGIDLSPDSTYDARENSKRLGVDNVTFLTADVGKALLKLKGESGYRDPDVVFIDPPRAGLEPKALAEVLSTRAKKIIYISCNPVTQQQNIAEMEKEGYRLHTLQPVDQFPQTHHLENIALLIKEEGS